MRSPIYPYPRHRHRHRPRAFALILTTLVVSTLVLLATPLLALLLALLLILLVIAIMALGARRGHHRAGSRRSPCCVCRDPPRDTGESGCDCRWGVHLHHPQSLSASPCTHHPVQPPCTASLTSPSTMPFTAPLPVCLPSAWLQHGPSEYHLGRGPVLDGVCAPLARRPGHCAA